MFPVPSMPIDQQRDAARTLAEWDSAIEKTEQLIALRAKTVKRRLLSRVVSIIWAGTEARRLFSRRCLAL